ncbi:MAG: CBS domain-containing protein, partial [Actinobacteria bacterium]|nr:CBS domain-containing protein [Actinomycetota bacterium]
EPALLTNFELIEERAALIENKSVEKLMIKDVVTVDEETPVMKIASLLLMKKIKRIPVVLDGKLLGTVSRADICNAVISVSRKV